MGAHILDFDFAPTDPGVYFLFCATTQLVKIGAGTGPGGIRARVRNFPTMVPTKLRLVGWTSTFTGQQAKEMEREQHSRWAEFRTHGEWFRFCPAMLEGAVRCGEPLPRQPKGAPWRGTDLRLVKRKLEREVDSLKRDAQLDPLPWLDDEKSGGVWFTDSEIRRIAHGEHPHHSHMEFFKQLRLYRGYPHHDYTPFRRLLLEFAFRFRELGLFGHEHVRSEVIRDGVAFRSEISREEARNNILRLFREALATDDPYYYFSSNLGF